MTTINAKYESGEIVLYSSYGACKITEIITKSFNNQSLEYYVLKPIYDEKSTYFVPTTNEQSVLKMHPIMSKSEVNCLLKSFPKDNLNWIINDNDRKAAFKDIIKSGDRTKLIVLIRTLHSHMNELNNMGKALHKIDEALLKDAEKVLYSEFAFVLGIDRNDVYDLIADGE